MLFPLGRHQRLGANELDHPLRRPLQVDVKTHRGVPRDHPPRQPFRRMEQRRQARVNQQAVDARGSRSLRAVVRAHGVPPQGSRQLEVRIRQPVRREGRQDRRRRPQRVIQVKVEVPPHQLRGRPVSRHIPCGVVPECVVEGWLGRYAVRHLGVQGICPPAQSTKDVAPAGGVREGLGQGVRLGAGRPLGGEYLSGRDALAHQDPHPPCRSIPDTPPPPRDSKGAPQNACQPDAPACARITRCATAVRRVSVTSTTSARHSATVCQCKRRDVTFASATRMGPGWGSTSPHLNKWRGGRPSTGGGGVVPAREPEPVGGGGQPQPPAEVCPSLVTGCREGGQWGSQVCLQDSHRPNSRCARVRLSTPAPIQGRVRRAAEGAAPGGAACRRGRAEGQALAPAQGRRAPSRP